MYKRVRHMVTLNVSRNRDTKFVALHSEKKKVRTILKNKMSRILSLGNNHEYAEDLVTSSSSSSSECKVLLTA